ncbi:hypothetical protein DI09_1p590 [Mitosporidium daphniae]|uniref:Uncharacterized protein n=1 Tax=Mitosporidium daphniae TaxID=1485682 RepID=A0A098VTQ0_9MICR|nr:uncharacterized protein DI09_1p590 [Mitosporidium daphniae]KGG52209.1 hypothetical protein DI09_1p590 [Mitosporidium daphniae]|eukprot:XP_013238636.1 uncharacterized protein DI09_1p590 [Mitosporidium daphniae]
MESGVELNPIKDQRHASGRRFSYLGLIVDQNEFLGLNLIAQTKALCPNGRVCGWCQLHFEARKELQWFG